MTPLSPWNPGDHVLLLAVNILIQVTLVTETGLAAAVIVRRNPARRYGVLWAALLLVLATPAVALVVQNSNRGLLTVSLATDDRTIGEEAAPAVTVNEPGRDTQPIVPDYPTGAVHPIDVAVAHDVPINDAPVSPLPLEAGAIVDDPSESNTAPAQSATPLATVLRAILPPLLSVWMVGVVILSVRLGIAWSRLAALLRSAKFVESPARLAALEQVCRELAVSRTPTLLQSSRVAGPVSTGLFRPCIVLPERMLERVTNEQFRAIIIHEAAHILRRDQITVLLQQISMTLFWLHPLVRVLNRRLARVREEICDNYVLLASDAPSYSRTLLELAGLIPSPSSLPGTVGLFTSRWKLDHRVAGLLDERRSQVTRLTRWHRASIAAFATGLLALTVCGTLTPAIGQTDETATGGAAGNDQSVASTDTDGVETSAATTSARSSGTATTADITGRVFQDGEPVVGAVVQAWYMGWMGRGWRPTTTEPVTTDASGRFLIAIPRDRISELKVIARTEDSSLSDLLEVSYSMDPERADVRSWLEDPARLPEFEFRLQPSVNRNIHVVDAEGRPVAEARVGAYLFSEWAFAEALSDAIGFAVMRIPAECDHYEFFAWKEGFALDYAYAGAAWRGARTTDDDPASPMTLTLGTPAALSITVVDAFTKQPVPEVSVVAQIPDKASLRASFAGMQLGYGLSAVTNSEGLATINWLPEWVSSGDRPGGVQQDSLRVWARRPQYASAAGTLAVGETTATVAVFGEFRLRGRVMHADGSPAAGIVVAAWSDEDVPIDRAVTAEDGRYELVAPPDLGTIVTVVDDTWGAAPQTEFDVESAGASARVADMVLHPAKRLYGRVTEVGGNRPVAGQQIWLHLFGEPNGTGRRPDGTTPRIEKPHATFTTWTDATGRYEFHVGPGTYSVVAPKELESGADGVVFARGYSHWSLNMPETEKEREQNFELALWTDGNSAQNPPRDNDDPNPSNPGAAGAAPINAEDPRIVAGRVVDESGDAIVGAAVVLPINRGFGTQRRDVVQGLTGADGVFRLAVPAAWLDPANWRHEATLWVHQPGFALGTADVRAQFQSHESGDTVEVVLPVESHPTFRILDDSGDPARGVTVAPRLYRTVRGYEFVPPEILPVLVAETNAEGHVAVEGIQQGRLFQLRVKSDRHGTQEFRVDTLPFGGELRLRQAAPLKGRVIGEDPTWVRNVTLEFTTTSGRSGAFTDAVGAAELTTDANGQFEIPLIATGDLQIVEGLDKSLPVRLRLPERVTVPVAEEIVLRLAPTARVSGRVLRQDDHAPVPGVSVSIRYGQSFQSEYVLTDASGRYEARVLPGRVRLQVVSIPDAELASVGTVPGINVPEGDETFELPVIELVSTYRKAGRLVDANGDPLAEYRVWAVNRNRRYGFDTTGDDGEFEMNLPSGVEIERYGYNSPDDKLGQATALQAEPLILRAEEPFPAR